MNECSRADFWLLLMTAKPTSPVSIRIHKALSFHINIIQFLMKQRNVVRASIDHDRSRSGRVFWRSSALMPGLSFSPACVCGLKVSKKPREILTFLLVPRSMSRVTNPGPPREAVFSRWRSAWIPILSRQGKMESFHRFPLDAPVERGRDTCAAAIYPHPLRLSFG